jgi:hypothetical protein
LFRANRKQPVVAAIVAATVVIAIGVAQTAAGQSLLRGAGLIGRADHYTELAFQHPDLLPGKSPAGRAPQRLPFTLRNAEGSPRTYRWTAVALHGERTTELTHGAVTLADGERALVRAHAVVDCAGDRTRVEIRLAGRPEAIGFWTSCVGVPPGG